MHGNEPAANTPWTLALLLAIACFLLALPCNAPKEFSPDELEQGGGHIEPCGGDHLPMH